MIRNRIRLLTAGAILAGLAIGAAPAPAAADDGMTTAGCGLLLNQISISSARAYEGTGGGFTPFVFTVTRAFCNEALTVDWKIKGISGAAQAGVDYADANGALFWPTGDMTSRTITVLVVRDGVDQSNGVFNVELTGPIVNTSGPGKGTILDDDGPMKWNIDDVACEEDSPPEGTFKSCTYTATRSHAGVASTVHVATTDGTATQPEDYLPQDVTHNVPASATKVTGTVWLRTDWWCESGQINEHLWLVLSQQSHGVILDSTGIMTIVNDDSCIS